MALLPTAARAAASLPEAPAITRGGIISYGRYADSLLLDPVLNDSNTDIWILSNLYDTLLLPTDDGHGVQPGLASAWQVSADGLTVTLALRPGTRFSDATAITAQDVKWSLDRARDPAKGIWSTLLGAVGEVRIADPRTVVLRLHHPDPAILSLLTVFNTAIMPRRQFEAAPGATDAEKAVAFSAHPVTSGPFVLTSWVHGATMQLRRNPCYWREGADGRPLPYLDGIRFEVIPDDATRILRVQSGELDGAEMIPFSRVAELQADPRLRLDLFASTRIDYVVLNVRPSLARGVANPLALPAVREALNDAVYRSGLDQIVTRGIGVPMSSYMSRATPLHVDVPDADRYDPARARALLRQAGYPHGFAATMQILAGNEDEIEIGTALQEMWREIGVDLHLQQLDMASITELYRQGRFTMRVSIWTDDIADPSEITSYFVYAPVIGAQHSGWHSPAAERLYLASGNELDHARRAAEYAQIQALFARGPIVRLYETPYAVVLRRAVHGFLQLPLGNNVFCATWLAR
ncbi:ABC transporter substrate-binding protein [Lichenicoccus sp.]|uniref:ABC transporter substrate-binding protein n=1 Tax=Lichenicoccus sp. TaxID=2781899 RepID=UPI003D0D1DF3